MNQTRREDHLSSGVMRVSLLVLLGVAGCGLTDPGDAAPEEIPLPGILAGVGLESPMPDLPERVNLGEVLMVPVQTLLVPPPAGPCTDWTRILEGPGETEIELRGTYGGETVVEIRLLDRLVPFEVQPELLHLQCASPALIPRAHREVTVIPPFPGTLTIRIVGRELRRGDRYDSPGRPRVMELTVQVDPPDDGG